MWKTGLDIETIEVIKTAIIWLYIASTIAVVVGVYLEGERFPERTKIRGWQILLAALTAETLLGGLMFAADARIDQIQKHEIIELETKLEPRSLSEAEISAIAATLSRFAPQEFTIASYGGEPAQAAGRLRLALERAGWTWFDPENPILLASGSVGIQVRAQSEGTRREAAKTLVGELKARFAETELMPPETARADPGNRIEILIGSKY
jgi:hypothetical protein